MAHNIRSGWNFLWFRKGILRKKYEEMGTYFEGGFIISDLKCGKKWI